MTIQEQREQLHKALNALNTIENSNELIIETAIESTSPVFVEKTVKILRKRKLEAINSYQLAIRTLVEGVCPEPVF